MTSEEDKNLAIVKAAFAAGAEGDYDKFFADLTPDAELHEADSLPYGGVYRGPEAVKRGVKTIYATWDEFKVDILQYGAGGDLVFVHMMISGVGRKTGKSFSMPVIDFWRLKNGKIVEIRPFYYDTHKAREVFG
jgi:uncharacterized protein